MKLRVDDDAHLQDLLDYLLGHSSWTRDEAAGINAEDAAAKLEAARHSVLATGRLEASLSGAEADQVKAAIENCSDENPTFAVYILED